MRREWLLLFTLLGCERRIVLTPPFDAEARAALLALETVRDVELHALAVRAPSASLQLDLQHDDDVKVTALYYRETLEALSIGEGPLPIDRSGEGTRHLPQPSAGGWSAVLSAGDVGAWARVYALDGTLAAVEIAGAPDPCADAEVKLTPDEHPLGSVFLDVAVASSTLAFAVWQPLAAAGAFVRLERGRPLEVIDLGGTPVGVDTDHRGTIFVAMFDGNVHQLGHDGVERVRTLLPFDAQVTVARDGTAFAYGRRGLAELVTGSDAYNALPDLPFDAVHVFAVARDRMVGLAPGEVWYFDGTAWRMEYRGPLVEDTDSGFGDERRLLVTTANYSLLERDDATGTWNEITTPAEGFGLADGVGLGGGRYFVVGAYGIAFLNLGRFCPQINTGVNRRFRAVDADPELRAGVAVTSAGARELPAYAFWLDLPPL